MRHRAVGEVAGEVVADVAEGGLVEGDVDLGALTAPVALEQRGEHAERRPGAGALVDQGRADACAGAAGLAGHRDQPACRLHQRVVAGLVAERPDVAVRAHGAVDEPWVALPEGARAETELLGEPRPEALEEDVGAVDEPEQRLAAARLAERERKRALPCIGGEEHRALAVPEGRPPGPAVVAGVGTLHLDDVGAQRGQDLGAVGAGDRGGDVEHLDACEWCRSHHAHHCRSGLCEDAVVFHQMIEWVSGSNWSYAAIFAVAVIDAFFPVVPSESMVIVAGTLAGAGELNLFLVVLAAWGGAVLGDNISYGIGKWAGEHTVRRLFRHEKAHKGFDWAELQLEERGSYIILIARFIPFGRTAVTFTAGYTKGLPWHRFFRYDLVAGGVWATYATMLGYLGGKQFEEQPWKGVLLGLGIAFTVAFVIEWVRKRRAKSPMPE